MNEIDQKQCPICHQANFCLQAETAASKDAACWCAKVDFPPAVIKKIPENLQNRVCICQSCLQKLTLATEVI
jgi:hypothetical protein